MIPKIIVESKIDPETQHYEYRARLDANYYLIVSPDIITSHLDSQSMIESELKEGLSNAVYGDIMKELRQINEVCSELKRVRTDYSDFGLLEDQIKKLENCANSIMNLCTFEFSDEVNTEDAMDAMDATVQEPEDEDETYPRYPVGFRGE